MSDREGDATLNDIRVAELRELHAMTCTLRDRLNASLSADQRAEMDGLIIRAATDKLVALRGSDVATLEQMRVVLAQLRAAADCYILARWDMGEHLGPSWNRVVFASLSLKDADDALAAALQHVTRASAAPGAPDVEHEV